MVGGKVISIAQKGDVVMLWCWDHRSADDECGVFVRRQPEMPEVGDDIWWHGQHVMWTPKDRRFCDRQLPKLGYSSSGPEMRNWPEKIA
jgi:hypothetical protein